MVFFEKLSLVMVVFILISCAFGNKEHCYPNLTNKEWRLSSADYLGNEIKKVKRETTSKIHYFTNFAPEVESGINEQINLELYAHYTYLSMAYHFKRHDINMEGFHNFFMKMAKEEHEHAQMFMDYQLKRGGSIVLHDIQRPCKKGIWGSGIMAMRSALKLEHNITNSLQKLHSQGENDPQFQDFLEANFLGEQMESIKQLTDYVFTLERMNDAIGEYHFDKMTLGEKQV